MVKNAIPERKQFPLRNLQFYQILLNIICQILQALRPFRDQMVEILN